jgi:hypothetical protein
MVGIRCYEYEHGRITIDLDVVGDDVQGLEPVGISGDGGTWQFESLRFFGVGRSQRRVVGVALPPTTTGSARARVVLVLDQQSRRTEAGTVRADLRITHGAGSAQEFQLVIDQRKLFNGEPDAVESG